MDPTAIRARRRSLRLTQQDLADLAGVSVRFIREVDHGKRSVRLDSLTAMLDALGLEMTLAIRSPRAAPAGDEDGH